MEGRDTHASEATPLKFSFTKDCRCGGKLRSPRKARCKSLTITTPIRRPDLAIYSQNQELNEGRIPGWDSPDITTYSIRPFKLRPETIVVIRNLSQTVPAINTLVHFFTSPFGIGTRREHKLTKIVNIPPQGQVELSFPLDSTTLKGDPKIGAHIQIEHPHDQNLENNAGSQVAYAGFTSEFESRSRINVRVPVYNNSNFAREIKLSLMPSDDVFAAAVMGLGPGLDLSSMSAQELAALSVYAPHEQRSVNLTASIPDHLHGTPDAFITRSVTLVGRLTTGELVGGVTMVIHIDD